MVTYVPKRGDIVWLAFDPQQGKEIQKTRPALVISPEKYNQKSGLALFMPITSKVKNYPFEVIIADPLIQGVVLCDQIRSLDWRLRSASFISSLEENIMQDVLLKLNTLLEI